MKKLIKTISALAISTLTAQTAFAAPATSYPCQGLNKVTGKNVAFEVMFSDHAREEGYTNQSITVTKEDNSTLTFQMFGATRKNHCKKNASGEIFLVKTFNMDSDSQGVTMDFKINCGNGVNYEVKGRCSRDY